jgi:glutathione S-transferase
MREEPLGDALLEAAHQVLKDELIPALPADRRHAALMVASAMSIAMRQARGGQGRERQELAALASLLAGAPSTVAAASDDVRARLQALNRALGQQIRHAPPGTPPLAPGVHAHLLHCARLTLLESSPKYLK